MRRQLSVSDNKYSRGIVAIAAGSPTYPGAAILTVGGARSGNAGYIKYLAKYQRLQDLVVSRFPDVVPIATLKNERFDSLVVGPGATKLNRIPDGVPLVLDSAAISLAKRARLATTVITPHEGELRFLGESLDRGREETAVSIAQRFDVFVVLKGNRTVIAAPDGELAIDEVGGPELATAGSGDILAGLIGSFLTSVKDGVSPFELIRNAVELHSSAGRYAANKFTSVTALEIMESLSNV